MSKRRIQFFLVLFGIGSLLLICRLYHLQVVKHTELQSLAMREMARIDASLPRGAIYDRLGREMALSVQVPSAYIITNKIKDKGSFLHTLSRVPWINIKKFKSALKEDKGFIWLKRKLTPQQKERMDKLIPGEIEYIKESERFYPHSDLAAPLIGFVGVDEKGLEGLELYFNKILQSEREKFPQELLSPSIDNLYFDIRTGYDLFLTTDLNIQYIAEEALKKGCECGNAHHGLLIIMDTITGEILTMANWPGYNSNRFFDSSKEYRRNRCITDVYEPGSTFKLFWAAALIEEGLVSSHDLVYCEDGFIVLYGRKIKDHKKYGWLTFQEVIENSSNVGAIKLVKRLGNRKFYDYIQRFGFGEKTTIEFPGEVKGIVRSPENWSGLSLPSISIGQEISITPIQMITAFSALVNGGRIMKPLILKKVCDPGGNSIEERHPLLVREVISKKTSEWMKNIMRGVVERGTGQKADIPGYWIGGKTGTAQIINKETGEYSHEDFLASFIGFFPDADARWAMIVMVDRPKTGSWGGEVAAPIFREVAEKVIQYYHIPPLYEDNPSGKGYLPRAAQLSRKSSVLN